MAWIKRGNIFNVDGLNDLALTHASVPTVDVFENYLKIYYASRDKQNRCRIFYIIVDIQNPSKILHVETKPIAELGKLGSFDESGMMPSSIVNFKNRKYLYYTGWSLCKTVPYHNTIGLLVSDDDGETYLRTGDGPVMGLTHQEGYFNGTATVIIEDGLWKNWYANCIKWELFDNKPEPFYHIKYCESIDGINWSRNSNVAIDFQNKLEGGIVRASVIKENEIYKMWFSYRKAFGYREIRDSSYRLGYAESMDGQNWTRDDSSSGMQISELGWDNFMQAYPNVVKTKENKFMFYNGNGFGLTGIGFAEWN